MAGSVTNRSCSIQLSCASRNCPCRNGWADNRPFDRKPATMTEELFRHDAYLKAAEAKVLHAEPGAIRLDRTVFYPTGGGQPGDTGTLTLADGSSLQIIDTVKSA